MPFKCIRVRQAATPFPRTVVGRPLIAKIPNVSIVSFIGVYGSKFTKFSTLVEHHGDYLLCKFEGVTAENFEKIAKNREFLHSYMQKRALCLPRGVKGQVRSSNVHFVGHCLMVPQPFLVFRNSLPFRSYKIRTVGTERDFSRFFSF